MSRVIPTFGSSGPVVAINSSTTFNYPVKSALCHRQRESITEIMEISDLMIPYLISVSPNHDRKVTEPDDHHADAVMWLYREKSKE